MGVVEKARAATGVGHGAALTTYTVVVAVAVAAKMRNVLGCGHTTLRYVTLPQGGGW